MGGRQFHKPVPKVRSQIIPASIPAVIAGDPPKWYQSTLLWGAGSLGAAIVLTVVAAMKHDIRWLLWIAIPLFVVAFWELVGYLTRIRWARSVATAVAGLVITCLLVWLYISLRPAEVQGNAFTPTPTPVTPEQSAAALKENIGKWLANAGWRGQAFAPGTKSEDGTVLLFGYVVDFPSRSRVIIFVRPDAPQVLYMQSKVFLSPGQVNAFNRLSFRRAQDLMQNLQLEMDRQKLHYNIKTEPEDSRINVDEQVSKGKKPRIKQQIVMVTNSVTTAAMDEFRFEKEMGEMDINIGFVENTRVALLGR
jgi:hypothetical protein